MGGALTHGIIVLEMETPGRSPTLAPAGPEDGQLSTEREGPSAETGTVAVATRKAKPTTELGKTGKRPTTLLRSQGLARRLRQRGPRGRWRGSSAPWSQLQVALGKTQSAEETL